jgi:hypothetical protein
VPGVKFPGGMSVGKSATIFVREALTVLKALSSTCTSGSLPKSVPVIVNVPLT